MPRLQDAAERGGNGRLRQLPSQGAPFAPARTLGPTRLTPRRRAPPPRHQEGELYVGRLQAMVEHERDFSRLWTQCQRCQGDLHKDVLCTSRDCPIYYRRVKVQKDLADARTVVERFGVPTW